MTKYEAVIGLEVHAELLTRTKIFCGCKSHFGGEVNAQVCPVCLGMPGVLPVMNRTVVEFAIKTALATHCQVRQHSKFDRKNYFYPDLPKGYQISQYDQPIAAGGWLEIEAGSQKQRIRLTRIHMEEDAGKLVHAGAERMAGSLYTLVDLNRAGVPLLEIVSEPDIRTSEEARAYVAELRSILREIGVCDGKMEEGSLRCDANVSIRPQGSDKLGTRVEIKNLNSLRFLQRAVDYEIQRQTAAIKAGEPIVQETRLWDESRNLTLSMRSKEAVHDYRYFPEPDLGLLQITPAWIAILQATLPELPAQKRERYQHLGLSPAEARVLVEESEVAAFFDATLAHGGDAKAVSNWLAGDIMAYLNENHKTLSQTCLTPPKLAEMLQLIDQGTISGKIAKTILAALLESAQTASQLVQEMGLTQISDAAQLVLLIAQVVSASPHQVQQYLEGKEKILGYFVGQVMKATQGRADPAATNQLVKAHLENLR